MTTGLLDSVRVLDVAGEPAAMTGRILADLGAEVVRVEPREGDPLREVPPFVDDTDRSLRFEAWNAGKVSVVADPGDESLDTLLEGAHVVIDTPGWPGTARLDWDRRAPGAVWVRVTPFGWTGPRSHWRASDLGVMAASGNMYATGEPDGPPVRCTEPSAYAHVGPEAAFAALTGLASGRPQHVDVSMTEVVYVANMAGISSYTRTGHRGARRGANIGRTREIWQTADGWVSFGLRGGPARVPTLEAITRLVEEDGIDAPAMSGRDWAAFRPGEASDEDLRAIEGAVEAFFARRTMRELHELAVADNLMWAPINSPAEIYGSAQLAAREFFGELGDLEGFPLSFVTVRSRDGEAAPARPRTPAPSPGAGPVPAWEPVRPDDAPDEAPRETMDHDAPAWSGTRLLEFGSGAAGPIATRYFAEHGATVVRVESTTRPDFLRVYALGPDNPHGLEGSELFDALNVGKRSITLNLKNSDARDLARRLALEWADAVSENFAPRAMPGFGLDYDTLAEARSDLVMVSACLNGNTGPHKNYPGFGSQGSALAGFTHLTGTPDRPPYGPHGTITDSLAPRFVATALAAGLLYRRRTGRGVYLDISQVEAALYTLAPWLLDYVTNGVSGQRMGNRSTRAHPHGAYPCRGDDRWVTIAVWNDEEWEQLADTIGLDPAGTSTLEARRRSADAIDEALAAWTRQRSAAEIADTLQALGIEAVPVADFGDVHSDPQSAARNHFVELTHPYLGPGSYERNGFRLSHAPSGYARPSPTLGQDNDLVLGDLLGIDPGERARLTADGALE